LFCGLLAACLFLTASARAGSWSGPTYTFSGTDGDGQSWDWSITTWRYGYNNNKPSYWGSGSASADVKATFTWIPALNNPSEPPSPLCVLETASASALTGSDTPSADDGLGDAATLGPTSAYSQGSHLTLAGTTSPVVLTHKLSTGCPNGETTQMSYQAAACPVNLDLGGTTPGSDGADILIGQKCTPTLSGGGGTLSGWQWKPGGTTFQSWSPSTPKIGTAPAIPGASYYVDGPIPSTNPTSWYWNDAQKTPETVSCTATVTPPAGQGSPFTVTATRQVTVYIPIVHAYGVGGNMQVNALAQNSSSIELYAGGTPGSSNPGGINWHATVSAPPGTTFGNGSLAIAQVISPNASITGLNQFQVPTNHPDSENGQTGLDGIFPYGWSDTSYYGGDEPGIPLDSSILSAQLSDSFVDYLMYQAPGSSQWVPVAKFYWSTNGNASIPSTGNWADFVGSAGTVTPSGSNVNFTPSNSFPTWTQTLGPGTFP